jgi:hypothetical protein
MKSELGRKIARNKIYSALSLLLIAVILAILVPAALAQASPSAHVSCVGIVNPSVSGVPGNAADSGKGLADLMASYLQGPSIKGIVLEAKLPSQAAEEARQKGCEPLLFLSLTRKPGGSHSFMHALGHGASVSSWSLPLGGSTGSAVARTGAVAGLQTAGSLAEATKNKDELRLEYRLQMSDGQVQFGPQTEHRTAKADGEDLLTPVVMSAAEAIVSRMPGK